MIYLLLSVLCSTAIFLIFKAFSVYKLNTFQAIVSNYLVAASFGLALSPDLSVLTSSFSEPWVIIGLGLGTLFIGLFYLMAYTSQQVGVAAASVATKMSLVLSMLFFVVFDPDERFTVWKILGLVFAIPGVYFASVKGKNQGINLRLLMYPMIIFVGSAVIDSTIGYCQDAYLHTDETRSAFAALPFIGAFSIGSIVLLLRRFSLGEKFRAKSLIGGLVLGIVNYGSIFFLIMAFHADLMDRSALIPVNNLAVVVLSSVGAIVVYREVLSRKNVIGLLLSVLALIFLFLD